MNLTDYLQLHVHAMRSIETNLSNVDAISALICATIKSGNTLITIGNGGSYSTASHFVCDLGKGVSNASKSPVRAICLNDNIATNSAWANDLSYDLALRRQLESFGREKDVLIIFSGSGNSKNVNEALQGARELGIKSIAFLGFDGGNSKGLADYSIVVDSHDMQVVENMHLLLAHWLFKDLPTRLQG
jgi:D-sedoheptulose 7-phosphate isomerase